LVSGMAPLLGSKAIERDHYIRVRAPEKWRRPRY
jgi:hypothetical protein